MSHVSHVFERVNKTHGHSRNVRVSNLTPRAAADGEGRTGEGNRSRRLRPRADGALGDAGAPFLTARRTRRSRRRLRREAGYEPERGVMSSRLAGRRAARVRVVVGCRRETLAEPHRRAQAPSFLAPSSELLHERAERRAAPPPWAVRPAEAPGRPHRSGMVTAPPCPEQCKRSHSRIPTHN